MTVWSRTGFGRASWATCSTDPSVLKSLEIGLLGLLDEAEVTAMQSNGLAMKRSQRLLAPAANSVPTKSSGHKDTDSRACSVCLCCSGCEQGPTTMPAPSTSLQYGTSTLGDQSGEDRSPLAEVQFHSASCTYRCYDSLSSTVYTKSYDSHTFGGNVRLAATTVANCKPDTRRTSVLASHPIRTSNSTLVAAPSHHVTIKITGRRDGLPRVDRQCRRRKSFESNKEKEIVNYRKNSSTSKTPS